MRNERNRATCASAISSSATRELLSMHELLPRPAEIIGKHEMPAACDSEFIPRLVRTDNARVPFARWLPLVSRHYASLGTHKSACTFAEPLFVRIFPINMYI